MDINTENIKNMLDKEPSVIFAYLYGSRAKGNVNHKSDWDIGIYFTKESLEIDPWHDFKIGAKLSQILKSEVEVVVLNKTLSPILGFEIIGRGKLLVDKDKNLRLDFENRVLRNYYDWLYFYKRDTKSILTNGFKESTKDNL